MYVFLSLFSKSGSLGFALSHKLFYILHPVGFISVIFTIARRSDKQLRLCSESVSMFYLKSFLSQQQLFCQPVSLSTYFIKNKPTCSLLPSVTCWSAARWEQEGPPRLPVRNQTIAHLSDWPWRQSPSLSLCCNSTPDRFCLCLN